MTLLNTEYRRVSVGVENLRNYIRNQSRILRLEYTVFLSNVVSKQNRQKGMTMNQIILPTNYIKYYSIFKNISVEAYYCNTEL